ncbi:MAG TPA: SDR family oxidoreductase [Thermomonas sp.]|jgi:NAD(P)-dependent dehydrogenase (short-subunit alcohol dehydrogenase family)|nr:SDR family oxidoreductase [Thermomonas sp.]HOZ25334.1 SDR family oxidoreductase [Thermomonas sp.]HPM57038.1 SDR family oxidoreductase [Thermomonas sp.]
MARTALVTGANRGIGLEFVRQLLARGDHVVATCRHPGKASALNALAGDHPARLHVLPLDVADAKSRASLVHDLPLVLGDDGRIDLLLNNAGVLHSGERFGHVEQATLDDSLRTNAIGPFLLAQALAPLLRDGTVAVDDAASPCTIIANISSQLGSITNTARFGTPSYAISKAAQNMASALLANALAGRGIVVLALHPGWVQTEMGGAQAQVTPVDAVAGLLRVIDAATPSQSGSFLDWRGEPLPW